MQDYFTALGFPLPMHENPADYYLDVVRWGGGWEGLPACPSWLHGLAMLCRLGELHLPDSSPPPDPPSDSFPPLTPPLTSPTPGCSGYVLRQGTVGVVDEDFTPPDLFTMWERVSELE